MRYTPQHKAETHERIVHKAAEEFRASGFEGTGIADLMARLGLTHGGFYAHFKSKDALVAQAAASGLEASIRRMVGAAESAPKGEEFQAILDFYLSPEHRDNPAQGCVLPALAGELARRPRSVRGPFTDEVNQCVERLARFMPGKTEASRKKRIMVFLSGIAGTILLARAVADRECSDEILRAAHEFYSGEFGRRGRVSG